jgi:hypothetical protein
MSQAGEPKEMLMRYDTYLYLHPRLHPQNTHCTKHRQLFILHCPTQSHASLMYVLIRTTKFPQRHNVPGGISHMHLLTTCVKRHAQNVMPRTNTNERCHPVYPSLSVCASYDPTSISIVSYAIRLHPTTRHPYTNPLLLLNPPLAIPSRQLLNLRYQLTNTERLTDNIIHTRRKQCSNLLRPCIRRNRNNRHMTPKLAFLLQFPDPGGTL